VLHRAQYSKANLYVLTIPDNFSDLYQYPAEVLNRIRTVITQDLDIRIEGPSQVSLFYYDNGTFIAESFLPEPVKINIVSKQPVASITDLLTNEVITGSDVSNPYLRNRQTSAERTFEITIKPHSYRVFRYK
jgi:hypothetical protein